MKRERERIYYYDRHTSEVVSAEVGFDDYAFAPDRFDPVYMIPYVDKNQIQALTYDDTGVISALRSRESGRTIELPREEDIKRQVIVLDDMAKEATYTASAMVAAARALRDIATLAEEDDLKLRMAKFDTEELESELERRRNGSVVRLPPENLPGGSDPWG